MTHLSVLCQGIRDFVQCQEATYSRSDALLADVRAHCDSVLSFEWALAQSLLCSPSSSLTATLPVICSRARDSSTSTLPWTTTATVSALSAEARAALRALVSRSVIDCSNEFSAPDAVDVVQRAVHRTLDVITQYGSIGGPAASGISAADIGRGATHKDALQTRHSGSTSPWTHPEANLSRHLSPSLSCYRPPLRAPASVLALEELLDRILEFALDLSPDELIAQSHPPSKMPAYRPGLLRVCRRWNRVGTPLLFRCVVLRTVLDVAALVHALALRTEEDSGSEGSSSGWSGEDDSDMEDDKVVLRTSYARKVRKLVILDSAVAGGELLHYVLDRTPNLECLVINLWNAPDFLVSAALGIAPRSAPIRTTYFLDGHRFNPLGVQWAFARWRNGLTAQLAAESNSASVSSVNTAVDTPVDDDAVEQTEELERVKVFMDTRPIDELLDGVPTRAYIVRELCDDQIALTLHIDITSPDPDPVFQFDSLMRPHRAQIWLVPTEHPGPFADAGLFVPKTRWPGSYTVDDFGQLRITLSFDTGGRPIT
ncbi:hypothetical protein BKA62DRAFT_830708 [Auriculariales sp. MPI-PUGE-AT-0066]|nr:hypothetical protein BKA62DRAFT_830708 [Auriculariales sp. MPI-PUGE-AT-0066]